MSNQEIKAAILKILKKYPVSKASLFGSFVRNQQNDASDIDILIETKQAVTLFDILNMEREIGETTKRKTDIVEFSAIKASLRENIMRDAVSIL